MELFWVRNKTTDKKSDKVQVYTSVSSKTGHIQVSNRALGTDRQMRDINKPNAA